MSVTKATRLQCVWQAILVLSFAAAGCGPLSGLRTLNLNGLSSALPVPLPPGNPGSGGSPTPGTPGLPVDGPLIFKVSNETTIERTETILASIPLPEGFYTSSALANMSVSNKGTSWRILQRWSDGSVKIAQAQFTDRIPANTQRTYTIVRDAPSLSGTFVRNNWVELLAGASQIGARVVDGAGGQYQALISLNETGTLMHQTPLVRTRRYRVFHQPQTPNSLGRDFLASNFYVTEFKDTPLVVVDWILANDYLGIDAIPAGSTDPNLRPLGDVNVSLATFLVTSNLQARGYMAERHAIQAGTSLGGNLMGFNVINQDYLSDAQTRRYRFILYAQPPGADPVESTHWTQSHSAMSGASLYALATFETWENSGGAGLLGGPVRAPLTTANNFARNTFLNFLGSNVFGTWGTYGDVKWTGTTGTPRNTPLSQDLAYAIQGEYTPLIQKLEQLAWAQSMRPYHLNGLIVGDSQNIQFANGLTHPISSESLGRRALVTNPLPLIYRNQASADAHGWNGYDDEHLTLDALFDYFTVTGDWWARDEIALFGQHLKGLYRRFGYFSVVQAVRGDGWWMACMAQVFQVTGDTNIRDYALYRVTEMVDVRRKKFHPSKAFAVQGNYAGTGYPGNYEFFMPWQHGAVLYGYLGAYRAWGHPLLLSIAEDVVYTVQYSWLQNVNHPTFGNITNGMRYYVPFSSQGVEIPANYWDSLVVHVGDSPLGGAHIFLIGGLLQLPRYSTRSEITALAVQYGSILRGPVSTLDRFNKWNFMIPPEFAQ